MKIQKYKIALFAALFTFVYSCKSLSKSTKDESKNAVFNFAEKSTIYNSNCIKCHGENGDLGRFSAPNLRKTSLSLQGITEVIKNGRGFMKGLSGKLSEKEINDLASLINKNKLK